MQVTIVQSEVEKAVRSYIRSIMVLQEGVDIVISFAATRGDDGLKAYIDIVPAEERAQAIQVEETKQAEKIEAREPEPVTGSAAEAEPAKQPAKKTKTLVVEQKAPETVAAAQVEEVATIAQAEVEEAATEQQAASGSNNGTGFPGFAAEDGNSDGAASSEAGDPEEQSAVADVATTTAEPVIRKSLFGGLARPSNH